MSLSNRSARLVRSLVPLTSSVGSFSTSSQLLAHEGYGDTKGGPKRENPQEQGENPSADKEHPGPPPPKAGQEGAKDKQSSSGGTQQKRSFSTRVASTRRQHRSVPISQTSRRQISSSASKLASAMKPSGDTKNAQPTILDENPPTEREASDDVRKHNEEVAQRAEKAENSVSNEDARKDKVRPEFWKGHGGQGEGMDKKT